MKTRIAPQQLAFSMDRGEFWSGLGDISELNNDPSLGRFKTWYGDEFPSYSSATAQGGWITYQDTGNTVFPANAAAPGYLAMTTDGTDEDEVHHQLGAATYGGLFKFSATADISHDQWLEYVFQVDRITTSAVSYFLGMATVGAAIADFLTDATGVISTTPSHVGFSSIASAPSVLRGVYITGSGTLGTPIANALTMAVSTWYRVGIRFRRSNLSCEWWSGTTTAPMTKQGTVAIALAGFPDDVVMTPMMGFKSNTATASNLYIHSIRYATRYQQAGR
jgi:hypothetical protein